MARKSTGRTGRKSNVRSSAKSTRSRGKRQSSKRGSSSRSSSSHGGSAKVVSISRGRKESSARGQSTGASKPAQAHALTDHNEIRGWAEERGAHPACVRGTGDRQDVVMIRLDFPGYSGEKSLEEIGWDEWFDKFDESGFALMVQEKTAHGQKSNFNKLVKREAAQASGQSAAGRSRRKRAS
jgi:hypothetical protein